MLTKYFLFDCSVIGLNFDFLALNIVGFTLYGCYNVAMFWIDSIQVTRITIMMTCISLIGAFQLTEYWVSRIFIDPFTV